jgi:hypothetical protein
MTGDYFSWLSHDDMYKKTKISTQVRFLSSKSTKNIILASNVTVLFENGLKKNESIHKDTFKYIDIFLATSANIGLNGCSLLIPKQAFLNCGYFDVTKPFTQDYDLWFRMKDKYNFVLIPNHLVISRRHMHQDSVQNNTKMTLDADKLHSYFLNNLNQSRFDDYFSNNANNIKHMIKNFQLYKTRGYLKTAIKLLFVILTFSNKHDRELFFKLYTTEILSPETENININNLTNENRYKITQEFKDYLNNSIEKVHLKPISSYTKNTIFGQRITDSLKSDGIFFTLKRAAYKLLKK